MQYFINHKGITRQMHSDSKKLHRSCLAMQLFVAGDLRRYLQKAINSAPGFSVMEK